MNIKQMKDADPLYTAYVCSYIPISNTTGPLLDQELFILQ
jgi:hypothetical protein